MYLRTLIAALAALVLSASASMAKPELCVASWYNLPGQKMANGEIFRSKARIVAHKTLPLGSWVSIVKVDKHSKTYGSTVCAQVQDRGPYISGRCVDVSKPLGRQLGLIAPGTAKVKVTAGCSS